MLKVPCSCLLRLPLCLGADEVPPKDLFAVESLTLGARYIIRVVIGAHLKFLLN